MSRAKRRQGLSGTSSKRTPTVPTAKRRVPVPWVPLGVIIGVFGVAGLIAYLIWQTGQPLGLSDAARAEANDDPGLPGEYVNLPEIYGGSTSPHVTGQSNFVADGNSNPPAGGPMWGSSACSNDPEDTPPNCGGAPWGVFRKPWAAETLNHNMEHGGVIVRYNTSHRPFLDDLEDFVAGKLRDGDLLVLTPYPEMEEETIAVTSWSRIDKFPVSESSEDRMNDFIKAHECRFNEGNC